MVLEGPLAIVVVILFLASMLASCLLPFVIIGLVAYLEARDWVAFFKDLAG